LNLSLYNSIELSSSQLRKLRLLSSNLHSGLTTSPRLRCEKWTESGFHPGLQQVGGKAKRSKIHSQFRALFNRARPIHLLTDFPIGTCEAYAYSTSCAMTKDSENGVQTRTTLTRKDQTHQSSPILGSITTEFARALILDFQKSALGDERSNPFLKKREEEERGIGRKVYDTKFNHWAPDEPRSGVEESCETFSLGEEVPFLWR